MAQVSADFETGTNTNNLSTGDTGSATAFDSVDTTGILIYDNTHAYDTLACKVGPTTAAAANFVWSTALAGPLTDMYGRVYVYPTVYPSVFYSIAKVTGASVRIGLLANGIGGASADGQIQVLTIDGSSVSTNAVPLNQWSRIEFRILANASTGILEVKLFLSPDSSTATETVTRSSANTGSSVSSFEFGVQSGGSSATYWLDNVVFGATSYPGPAGAAAQTLAPTTDSVDGAWTDQSGGSSLFAAIDETSYSDADYIRSELSPSASGCRVRLATGGDPASSSGHKINWRAGKSATGGQTVNMTVKLYQGGGNSLGGGTLIADFDRNAVDALTTYTETLSGGEADSITDYADLYLEFWATV